MRFFGLLGMLRVHIFGCCCSSRLAHFRYYIGAESRSRLFASIPFNHINTATTESAYIFHINITTDPILPAARHRLALIVELKESFAITVIIPVTITYCAHNEPARVGKKV